MVGKEKPSTQPWINHTQMVSTRMYGVISYSMRLSWIAWASASGAVLYLLQAALPLLSNWQHSTPACCHGVFSSSQKVWRKSDRSLAAPRRSAPHPFRAAWYVGKKLSDKTTSPARLGETCWGRMKGGEGERESVRDECRAQRLFP